MFKSPIDIAHFVTAIVLIVGGLLVFGWYALAGHILRLAILTRTKKTKWTRGCATKHDTTEKIYSDGEAWFQKNKEHKKNLHIVNDGLNLYGEYFDFGYDRAVIFVSGRTEALNYGYFFVQPYPEMGYNVLVFDQRAHGRSDGKYNTLGFEEHKDLLKWAELLHTTFGNKEIVLHGICIGSSTCLQALVSEKCPDYLIGMIADGMYTNFYQSFNNHLVEFKQPEFPIMNFAELSYRCATGYSMKYGNINFINKLTKPILFIHSKEDKYSLPYMADELIARVPHENKRLVWFEHGKHSHLRPLDPEKYDNAVKGFLVEFFDKALVK